MFSRENNIITYDIDSTGQPNGFQPGLISVFYLDGQGDIKTYHGRPVLITKDYVYLYDYKKNRIIMRWDYVTIKIYNSTFDTGNHFFGIMELTTNGLKCSVCGALLQRNNRDETHYLTNRICKDLQRRSNGSNSGPNLPPSNVNIPLPDFNRDTIPRPGNSV